MFSIFWHFIIFIITFTILVTIHEFGHFWMARKCGVLVECFSIGFGKTLWKFRDSLGTEFIIALIPLGGYVKLLENDNNNIHDNLYSKSLNNKSVLKRLLIVIAGPISNFIFSIFLYWIIFIHGFSGIRPVVSEVLHNSIANQSHIKPNMEIKAIDNINTPDLDTLRMELITKIGNKNVIFTVTNFGENNVQKKILNIQNWNFKIDQGDPIISLGIIPYNKKIENIIAKVLKNSPASKAGIKINDKIIKINNIPLTKWSLFVDQVRNNVGKYIKIEVLRNKKLQFLTVKPEIKKNNKMEGFIGVIPRITELPKKFNIIRKYGVFKSISYASKEIWNLIKLTVIISSKLITGNIGLHNLSGPISIAHGAEVSIKYGIIYYLMFLALISINLGVINLFPIPILDGGHLLFLTIEQLTGKPISNKIKILAYQIGSIILMLLTVIAVFNDLFLFR